MQALTAKIQHGDWWEVIAGFLEAVSYNPDWLDNLLAASRYSWKLFLDLPDDAVVLDLGCGLGNLSQSLSQNVAHLYAMDLTIERLQFTDQRLKKFSPDRRIDLLAGGDGDRLPFADNSFDLVCLSGVLEWVPDIDELWQQSGNKLQLLLRMILVNIGKDNPKSMQLDFLREISRILKPGGQIFIAIENRHNYQYFGGRPDHHSGLPYGALMPRWAANLYSIWRNRRPYRTYTYGRRGYKTLLSSADFSKIETIGLYPGYSHLKRLRPFELQSYCEDDFAEHGLIARFKRAPATSPAYGVVGYKRPVPQTSGNKFVDRLLTHLLEASGSYDGNFCLAQVFISSKDKTVMKVRANQGLLAVRLPWEIGSTAQERVNNHWLNFFADHDLKHVRLPKPVVKGSYQGVNYFAESWFDEKNDFQGGKTADVSMLFDKATCTLAELRSQGKIDKSSLSGDIYQRFVGVPLASVGSVVEADIADRIADTVSKLVKDKIVRTGITHGDFSVSNLLGLTGSGVPALIDWEFGEIDGVLGLDEIGFFSSLGRELGYFESTVDCVKEIMNGMNSEFGQAFRNSVDRTLIEPANNNGSLEADWTCLGTLYWLDHVEKQLKGPSRFDRKWLAANVEAFTEI